MSGGPAEKEGARLVGPLPFVRLPVAAAEGCEGFRGPFVSRASVALGAGDRLLLVVQDDAGNDLAYVHAEVAGRQIGGILTGETIIFEPEGQPER